MQPRGLLDLGDLNRSARSFVRSYAWVRSPLSQPVLLDLNDLNLVSGGALSRYASRPWTITVNRGRDVNRVFEYVAVGVYEGFDW